MHLNENSQLVNQTLAEANIRSRSGASIVALIRDNQLVANPKSSTQFAAGDRIGVIGENDQVESARQIIEGSDGLSLEIAQL